MSLPNKVDFKRLSDGIAALVELVVRLRGPEGCPWDAKQTDSSIKIYLLEEAYEVLDAIESSSSRDVCMELGDLLFHIIFLAHLASERNEFDFVDVVEKIREKMIHRHPHVFGETSVNSAKEVARNWVKIKKAEKEAKEEGTSPFLESVPVNLPALLRAHRLSERASKVDFDWPNPGKVWEKVQEEVGELGTAIAKADGEEIAEEMGDLLFSLVNLARHWGFNAEDLLRNANKKFLERFKMMETELNASEVELEDATPEQMNQAWEKVKS